MRYGWGRGLPKGTAAGMTARGARHPLWVTGAREDRAPSRDDELGAATSHACRGVDGRRELAAAVAVSASGSELSGDGAPWARHPPAPWKGQSDAGVFACDFREGAPRISIRGDRGVLCGMTISRVHVSR
eukprot:gene33369-24053_t